MKRAILYLPYLAPYRVDVLNALSKKYDLLVLFAFKNAREHNFDYDHLQDRIDFKYDYLRTFTIGIRPIHPGLFWKLYCYKPDIIFSNEFGYFTSLVGLFYSKLINCKHVLTTSDNPIIFENSSFLRKKLRDLAVYNSDGIVVYTPYVASSYRDRYTPFSVQICPNIQNTFPSSNVGYCKKNSRLDNIRRFCYVGRFDSFKGLDILISAFSILKRVDWQLNLVGYGSLEVDIRKWIKQNGLENNVSIHGKMSGPKLGRFYIENDILILPSRYEPFGAVVNEALSMGLPSIVSDVCGAKMYIENGVNGYIFKSEDGFDLMRCLRSSMDNYESLLEGEIWTHRVEDYIGAYSYDNFA